MGNCTFGGKREEPESPEFIPPDPSIDEPLHVTVTKIGYTHHHPAYGVLHKDSSKSQLWLWFRKRDVFGGHYKIQLENFVRNHPKQKHLGQILYYALCQKQPQIKWFQRISGSGNDYYRGFLENSEKVGVYNDQYYLQHSFHGHHLPTKNFLNKTGLVTKWQFYSIADCYDGDLGRGVRCQRSEMKLEILVTGTAITTYVEIEDEITVFDGSSQKLNKEVAHRTVRDTTNFVDNIQYRVTVNNQTWMTWIIAGDSLPPGTTPNDLTVIHTPLFKVVLEGGWSHRSKVHVHTRGDVDPALALLFAHLMTSEYAIPEIKSQIMFPIPSTCPDGSSLVNSVQSGLIIAESEGFSMVE